MTAAVPSSQATRPSHVFVVGLPRTGTHLVRDVIADSGSVRLGPEARFMRGAPRFGVYTRPGLVQVFPHDDRGLPVAVARRLLDDVFAATRPGPWRTVYWQRLSEVHDRAEFVEEFLRTPRRARDLFDLAMRAHARGAVPGDKTPANLWSLERLLAWYPQARVVHMIRDPRAIYASMLRKGWVGPPRLRLPDTTLVRLGVGSMTAYDLARNWRDAMALDRRLAARFPDRYLSCRFEDLVGDPGPTVQRVADHFGLEVRPSMLQPSVVASSYMSRGTPGFRVEAIDAWREHLDPPLGRWLSRLTAPALVGQGYPPG